MKKQTIAQRHKAILETINSFSHAINSLSERMKALELRPPYQQDNSKITNHIFQCIGVSNVNCTQCGNPREDHKL